MRSTLAGVCLGLTALVALVGGGSPALAGQPILARTADAAQLREAATDELELTRAATALAKAQKALERERESIDWATALLVSRGRENLRKLEAYRERRVDREALGVVRARKLYKLARGGGMLELVFEDGDDGRLTPHQRVNRARSLRTLVDHDLDALRVHAEAEDRAQEQLLAATRELEVLAALDSISRLQAGALALTQTQLDPALHTTRARRTELQRELGGGFPREDRELLQDIIEARRTLVRHRGLDMLEPHSLVRPVRGRVVGKFGTSDDPLLGVPMHRNGVEFVASTNEQVKALAPGEVVLVGALPGFERVVVIDHGGGYLSLTARLLSVTVEEGQEVEAGTVLGRVGAKAVPDGLGTTAYVEIRHGQRPIDPTPYLK